MSNVNILPSSGPAVPASALGRSSIVTSNFDGARAQQPFPIGTLLDQYFDPFDVTQTASGIFPIGMATTGGIPGQAFGVAQSGALTLTGGQWAHIASPSGPLGIAADSVFVASPFAPGTICSLGELTEYNSEHSDSPVPIIKIGITTSSQSGLTTTLSLSIESWASGDGISTENVPNEFEVLTEPGVLRAKALTDRLTREDDPVPAGGGIAGAAFYVAGRNLYPAIATSAATSAVIALSVATWTVDPFLQPIPVYAGPLALTNDQWDAVAGTSGGLTPGAVYYLSDATAGHLTATPPGGGEGHWIIKVGVARSATVLVIQIGDAVLSPSE